MSNIESIKEEKLLTFAAVTLMTITIIQKVKLKIKKSNFYHDDRQKLRVYLTQCDLYIEFHVNLFNESKKKVL